MSYSLIHGSTPKWVAVVCCGAMCAQFTTYAIARAHVKTTQCDQVTLLFSECLKLIISLGLLNKWSDINQSVHMAVVPTICFCAMNMLSFWALRWVSASTFVLVLQLKMIWTALFSRVLLGRTLTLLHGLAMLAIGAGVAAVTAPAQEDGVHAMKTKRIWAILALVLETFLSGFSTAWTQMSFDSQSATMWARNAQLAGMSCVIYTGMGVYQQCDFIPTPIGLMFSVMGAFGGILVAMTILYAGALEKTISTNCSTAFTFVVEAVLFGQHLNLAQILACVCVFVNCWIFVRLPNPNDDLP